MMKNLLSDLQNIFEIREKTIGFYCLIFYNIFGIIATDIL